MKKKSLYTAFDVSKAILVYKKKAERYDFEEIIDQVRELLQDCVAEIAPGAVKVIDEAENQGLIDAIQVRQEELYPAVAEAFRQQLGVVFRGRSYP